MKTLEEQIAELQDRLNKLENNLKFGWTKLEHRDCKSEPRAPGLLQGLRPSLYKVETQTRSGSCGTQQGTDLK